MKYRHIIPIVLAILISAVSVEAYVLHGLHILELMAREMGQAQSLQAMQTQIIHQSQESLSAQPEVPRRYGPPDLKAEHRSAPLLIPQPEPITLSETVMYFFPDAFRSEISSPYSKRVHVFSKGASVTVIDEQVVGDHESEFDLYKDLFLYNKRELLAARLPKVGVDPNVSSIGRFQGRVAYVVGAQYPDESVPQVWVDKNTFRPFRWIIRPMTPSNPLDGLEVRFYGWRKIGSIWYPVRIEFYQGERLIRTIQIDNVRVDLDLPQRLFDVQRLRAEYPKRRAVIPEQRQPEEKSEAQETVDKFRKLFE
jgi:hypothetical protein